MIPPKCPYCNLVYTGNHHDIDSCPDAPTTVDKIIKEIFNLPMNHFFELMTKIQEKMLEYQANLDDFKFK